MKVNNKIYFITFLTIYILVYSIMVVDGNAFTTKEYIWQMVLIMKIVAINKIYDKLKVSSVEMPNVPYSNRYGQIETSEIEF